jgi:hypothetical protein
LNTLTTAAVAAGAIIALTAFSKAKAAGTLNFYPEGVRSLSFDGITPVISIGLVIQNPSSNSFQIKSLVGNLSANGFLIGNVSTYQPVTVRPNSQSVLVLNVRLSILGVVTDIINAFQGNGVQQIMNFKAWANVDNYSAPITITYKIP